jgi:hypothetical protein
VHFECELLHDYYLVKAKVDANPDCGFTMEQLCNSNWMGRTHDLDWGLFGDYSTDMGVGEGGWRYHQINSKGYDRHSIMNYGSENAFAAVGNCAAAGVTYCPLVRWKKGKYPGPGVKPNKDNAEIIPEPTEVTNADAYAIQLLYPWKGWGTLPQARRIRRVALHLFLLCLVAGVV